MDGRSCLGSAANALPRGLRPMPPSADPLAPSLDPVDDGALASPPPPPSAPPSPLARRLGGLARRAAWRVLWPAERGPYLPGERPRALVRLYYQAVDGWRSPLFWVPPRPGGSGEPVVLAHALGLSPDAFRLHARASLAEALSRAGFSVYLLAHRGDTAAIQPPEHRDFDFDAVLERDVPAALARVAEHSGLPRAHWIGHGLGGQLGLGWAGRAGPGALASVVAIAAPASFSDGGVRSELVRAGRVAALLPAHWHVPTRGLAWALAPGVGGGLAVAGLASSNTRGALARGLLCHGADDPACGLIAQIGRWVASGTWSDRTELLDYAATLGAADAPLLVLAGSEDRVCPPSDALAAMGAWGGSPRAQLVIPGYAHLDPLTADDVEERVIDPIVAFLVRHRRRAWPEGA